MNKKIPIMVLLALLSGHSQAELDELPAIEASIDDEYSFLEGPSLIDEGNQAVAETKVLNSAPINVDGYVKEKEAPKDHELVEIQKEIARQKQEMQLNKQKAKSFKALSQSTQVLSETTVEMLEERRAAQEQIAEYNEKVKCLSANKPGPECDKHIRSRR